MFTHLSKYHSCSRYYDTSSVPVEPVVAEMYSFHEQVNILHHNCLAADVNFEQQGAHFAFWTFVLIIIQLKILRTEILVVEK